MTRHMRTHSHAFGSRRNALPQARSSAPHVLVLGPEGQASIVAPERSPSFAPANDLMPESIVNVDPAANHGFAVSPDDGTTPSPPPSDVFPPTSDADPFPNAGVVPPPPSASGFPTIPKNDDPLLRSAAAQAHGASMSAASPTGTRSSQKEHSATQPALSQPTSVSLRQPSSILQPQSATASRKTADPSQSTQSTGLSTAVSSAATPTSATSSSAPTSISSISSIAVPVSSVQPTDLPSSSLTATAQSSTTVLVAPSSSAASSPSNHAMSTHSAIFYIGIALGVIVVVAVLAALTAWYIKLRAHAKRRRDFVATSVPWGRRSPEDDEQGMIEVPLDDEVFGINRRQSNGAMARNSISTQWEPAGDRDVGEPRRVDNLPQPLKRVATIAPAAGIGYPFADEYNSGSLADSLVFPTDHSGPYPNTRPLPSHLLQADFERAKSRTGALGRLSVANIMPGDVSSGDESSRPGTGMLNVMNDGFNGAMPIGFGTPREASPGTRPRFWGLNGGDGLEVPWAPDHANEQTPAELPIPSSMLSNASPATKSATPAANEGWTSTLKNSLANALNAVKGNNSLPGETFDILTPTPRRVSISRDLQQQQRTSARVVSRRDTAITTSSRRRAQILELEGQTYDGRPDFGYTPDISRTTLAYLDSDTEGSIGGVVPRAPLIRKPTLLPTSGKPQRLAHDLDGPLSRANTGRSQYSVSPEVYGYYGYETSPPPQLPGISRASTMRTTASSSGMDSDAHTPYYRPPKKSFHKRKTLARMSTTATDSSFSSDVSRATERLTDKEEAAKTALRNRRRKLAGSSRRH
ncbi:hypothetical protein PLICRDRAFT_58027 [Plicaturopsis crispa FD-325 SS-3]|uniref:Uncharacterized protein n=1 Tax=Plicaturopsis crispa FD-325 SS-3 TaxID=944288 RepID=A0A0C9SR21_PLICR|nr:hypothetical protein PLICRDRAFT_58027 [Plicaturopsis crispa FD-325 SS-3]